VLARPAAAARRAWRRLPPRTRRALPLILVLVVGIWIGNALFGARHAHPSDAELGEVSASAVEVWTCSMHPQIRQPEPGNCPICGMALIPVQTGGGHDYGPVAAVSVSAEAAALMAVRVLPAERRALAGLTALAGRIDYDERLVHDVTVRTGGQVERLHVNFASAPVGRGQRLAEVYSPEILAASQELIHARRAAEQGGLPELAEAARTQLLLLGVSEAEVDRVVASGQPTRTFTVYAPAGGVVTELDVRQGEWVEPGARLMQVGGVGQVWAQFEAYESDLAGLRVGQTVRFTVEAFPGERFQGPVAFIDPVVDGARRTARVRVQVPNPGGRLKPGMLARGMVTGRASADAPLVIPASAPLVTGRRTLVYVQVPAADRPTFEPREVTLGPRAGDFFEVASGLMEGELVVVNGAFRLDSELQIRGGPSLMNPEGGAPVRGHDHGEPLGLPAGQAPAPAPPGLSPAGQAAGVVLGPVVDGYLAFTDALVVSDAGAARTAAARTERALRAVAADDPAWRSQRDAVTAALAPARRDGADLEALRAALPALTAAVEEAARAFGPGGGPLHRTFCPMAFDNRGAAWLQRDRTVANPYFGEAMLNCGEVQTTLG
jgi:membrane fusion protein, copper/silver efflux system